MNGPGYRSIKVVIFFLHTPTWKKRDKFFLVQVKKSSKTRWFSPYSGGRYLLVRYNYGWKWCVDFITPPPLSPHQRFRRFYRLLFITPPIRHKHFVTPSRCFSCTPPPPGEGYLCLWSCGLPLLIVMYRDLKCSSTSLAPPPVWIPHPSSCNLSL